jgi:hypothetical protein
MTPSGPKPGRLPQHHQLVDIACWLALNVGPPGAVPDKRVNIIRDNGKRQKTKKFSAYHPSMLPNLQPTLAHQPDFLYQSHPGRPHTLQCT